MKLFRNLNVGTKLFAILLAPVVVLVALATIGATERFDEAEDAEQLEELAELARANADAIQELQLEMVASAVYLGSDGALGADELADQRERTDEAREGLEVTLATTDLGGAPELLQAVGQAETRLSQIELQRNAVDDFSAEPPAALGQYNELLSDMIELNAVISRATDDPTLARELSSFVDLGRLKAATAYEGSLLTVVTERGGYVKWDLDGVHPCGDGNIPPAADPDCSTYQAAATAADTRDRASGVFTENAGSAALSVQRDRTAGIPFNQFQGQLLEAAQEGPVLDADMVPADPDVWLDTALSQVGALFEAEAALIDQVLADADEIASSASTEALIFVIGTAAAVLLALVFALLMARATAGPLRRLTKAAYTLSAERLPRLVERLRNPAEEGGESLFEDLTPIDIDSRDEIGRLAEAFNSIQEVTVEVAEEQSQLLRKGIGDIFINLARRNQTLLDRQIEFIDQLEANEEDPDQLNDLFKLDHLATRMRRNAESLLVLAGAEPPRRRGRPVPLADVVRVAIGEIEDFARIQIRTLDEATVGGNVAVDLAHLLSELMENATHFSPPDTAVEVSGNYGEDGYEITVVDKGIGMSTEQLVDANRQLATPPLVGLAMSRSLGFIVIGRLAARFGIDVRLAPSPSGGIRATVTLPNELMESGEPEAAPDRPVEEPAPTGPAGLAEPPDDLSLLSESLGTDENNLFAPIEEPAAESLPEPPAAPLPPPPPPPPLEPDPPSEVTPAWAVDEGDALIDELYRRGRIPEEEFERGLRSLVSDELPAAPPEAPLPERPVAGSVAPPEPAAPEPAPSAPAPPEPPEPVREATPEPVGEETPEPAAAPASESSAEITAAGLVKRTPKRRGERPAGFGRPSSSNDTPVAQSQRSPEEIRKMLSRYRSGLNKGREGADANDQQ